MNDAPLRDNVAKNLKIYRKERGLTQQQLAEKAKISARYIAKIEAGTNLTLDSLDQLATALQLDPIELLVDTKTLQKTKKDSLELAMKIIKSYTDTL